MTDLPTVPMQDTCDVNAPCGATCSGAAEVDLPALSSSKRDPASSHFLPLGNNCSGHCSLLELAQSAFDILIVFEIDGLEFEAVNVRGREILGIAEWEPVNQLTWPDFVSGELVTVMLFDIVPRLARGECWRGELTMRRRDGVAVPTHAYVAKLASRDDRQVAILGAFDRSDNAKLLSALKFEHQLLHALLKTVPESVYFKDLDSRFIRVSAAKAEKSGAKSPEDLIGRSDFDHFSGEHAQQAYLDEQKIIKTGEGFIDLEEKETWPDGHVTWVSSTKLPLRDPSGRIIGTFGVSRDITQSKLAEEERRRLEVQLNMAQKMESIGRLAAGIAHEVNTPTQFISDNTHFLIDATRQISSVIGAYREILRKAAAGDGTNAEALAAAQAAEEASEIDYLLGEIPRTLAQTLEGIGRIAKIVRSLKEFSHPSSPDLHPADLNRAIETTVTVARHEWKYVAEVVTDLDPDLPLVPCMLDEFNQAILNLVVNASHAIADVVKDSGQHGRITIRTRRDGDWALVEVEDTGTGIPPAVQARIFEPFFTTKAVGRGTGQGLAMVQAIVVRKHRGQISFTTCPGKGTTFHMRLPVTEQQQTAATP